MKVINYRPSENVQLQTAVGTISPSQVSAEQIRDWIVDYLAELLEISEGDIETNVPFDRYGLDSSAAIGLTGDLEDWLGKEVDPTLLYDYPTVEALVEYLAEDDLPGEGDLLGA